MATEDHHGPATYETMCSIHKLTADLMLKALQDGKVNAFLLHVIIGFLKNNGIIAVKSYPQMQQGLQRARDASLAIPFPHPHG